MGESLPEAVEPAKMTALEKAVSTVPAESKWRPTPEMVKFVTGRILNPQLKRRITLIRKLKLDVALVTSWFQSPAFLDWYAECAERADQLPLDEVLGQVMSRALKGSRKDAVWILENFHKRVIKRRRAAASAQAGAVAHVTVEIIPPRDKAVRECEARIVDAKIV